MGTLELDALRGAIVSCDEPGLVAAWLFGSRARGRARPESDIDVAVLYSRAPEATLAALPERLATVLEEVSGMEADVVVINRASPDLVHRVLRDGLLLLDRDPPARLRFEVRQRNEYFDLQPALARYRRGPRAEAKR